MIHVCKIPALDTIKIIDIKQNKCQAIKVSVYRYADVGQVSQQTRTKYLASRTYMNQKGDRCPRLDGLLIDDSDYTSYSIAMSR